MKCLVTGAAGFVGSSLCDRLLSDGHKVVGIDCFVDYYPRAVKMTNLESARNSKNFEFIEGHLLNIDLESLLGDCDYVYHQAAQAGVRASWGKSFEGYTEHNISATQRLLEGAKGKRNLKKIVYASSSSVYGNAERYPTSEQIVPQPISPYGVTKLAGEHLMTLYAKAYGVPTVSLRYFTVYGPRQRPDMAFNRFIKAGLAGEPIAIYGDGTQSRDFTYIDDCLAANILAAEKGGAGEVYNIGGGSQVELNQVLKILSDELGRLNIKYCERQLGDAMHTGSDSSKARTELGFSPKVGLKEGLRAEIDWLKRSAADA
ncbi:MAG: UDP-glucose 4-epimerase [Proteobacteria bacterium]|nr:MAG: UDP-glucose 4-epimerase [Pseudomonadota bacterium]